MRSIVLLHSSHNITIPAGAKIEKRPTGPGFSRDGTYVVCGSPIFAGFDYECRLSVADDGSFQLRDRITPSAGATTIFQVPTDKHVQIKSGEVTVWNTDRSASMTISFPPKSP